MLKQIHILQSLQIQTSYKHSLYIYDKVDHSFKTMISWFPACNAPIVILLNHMISGFY